MGVTSAWGSGVPLQQCQACGGTPDAGERCQVCGASTPEDEHIVTYTLTVTVVRPVVVYDADDTRENVAEWMMSQEAKLALEKDVLQALRKLDGDCDVEVMDCEETDGL